MCSVSSLLCYKQMNYIPGINLSIRPRVAVWCQLQRALGDTAGIECLSDAGWGMVCQAEGLCFKVIGRPVSQVLPPTDGLGTGPTVPANLITPKTVFFQFTEMHRRISELKSEVLMWVRVTSCGTWRREKQLKFVLDYSRGAYISPPPKKNLAPTSKFQTPEGWCEASSTLRIYRY